MTRTEDINEFSKLIKPDMILKVDFGENNFNNRVYHVLDIYDGDEIAVKYWGKHKQRWFYEFQSIWYFYYANLSGNLTIKD